MTGYRILKPPSLATINERCLNVFIAKFLSYTDIARRLIQKYHINGMQLKIFNFARYIQGNKIS